MDPLKHKQYTGVDNSLILENIAKLAGEAKELIVRVPTVPGVNAPELEGYQGCGNLYGLPLHQFLQVL